MPEPSGKREESFEERPDEQRPTDDQEYGSLTVEDDPAGTQDPADLAGTANSDDAQVGPAEHE
jgi:hypothetical protein